MIDKLVLFGASGDLAARYLMPALAALEAAGELPDRFEVIGAAQQGWDDASFRRHAATALERHAAALPTAVRDSLRDRLRYRRLDVSDPGGVAALLEDEAAGGDPVAVYLALPTGLLAAAVKALAAGHLPPGSRIAIEKPFGDDLKGAVALNAQLSELAGAAGEEAIYRVDHVLGLATAQNLLALRLANPVLEPLWNGAHIDRIELLWEETLALEGRAAYYDRAGALKDVMQNHMLQLLCLCALEPPPSLGAEDLRDAKLEVLRGLTLVDWSSMRARYTAGRIGDMDIPAYVDEEGVDPERETETFAEFALELDTPRWAGASFVLRAGKALAAQRREVVVHFRPLPKPPFAAAPANALRIGIDGPDDLVLRLAGSSAVGGESAPVELSGMPPDSRLPAYGRVLREILAGESRLSVRGDEAEEAWRVVSPVLEAWKEGKVPLQGYPAGSSGPGR
jgi:glucose-6-phosphate 1-dehydrogenase